MDKEATEMSWVIIENDIGHKCRNNLQAVQQTKERRVGKENRRKMTEHNQVNHPCTC